MKGTVKFPAQNSFCSWRIVGAIFPPSHHLGPVNLFQAKGNRTWFHPWGRLPASRGLFSGLILLVFILNNVIPWSLTGGYLGLAGELWKVENTPANQAIHSLKVAIFCGID